MKTQIIQLEVHDDTISVRDKMDWSQTPRVLLVWPDKGKVLRSRLDLVLLERYCTSHGSQLALVTRDPEVIFQAGEVGIPVYQLKSTAQIQPWRKSFREFDRRELVSKAAEGRDFDPNPEEEKTLQRDLPAWARIGIFITALVGVLAVLGMLLPSATIVIDEQVNEQFLEIPLQAIQGEKQVQLSGILPIKEIQVTLSAEVNVTATGSVLIPSEKASGEVVFTNLGEYSITIPKGSVLSTSDDEPIQFLTTISGRLTGGIGEEVSLPVIALTPGEIGNLTEGEINTIGGSLGASLSATNPAPTSGGKDILIKAPNTSDRRQAERKLSAVLYQQAQAEIGRILEEGDILLSPDLDAYIILEEIFTPEEGEPGSELIASREVTYLIPYTARKDLEQLADDLVQAQYQSGQLQPIMDSIQIEGISNPQKQSNGSYSWEARITWSDQVRLDQNEIIQIVLGKNRNQAINLIEEEFKLELTPQVILKPAWWSTLPVLPFRIEIVQGDS